MALVTVIIPTYNRAALIGRAIRSVLAQYDVAAEIIVVDDGSTDATRDVVMAFPEVAYYYQPNRGQAAARNLGLRFATGAFVASLDSDDYWAPDFLHRSLACLQRHQLDFVFLNWTNSNGRRNYFEQMMQANQGIQRQYGHDEDWRLLNSAQVRQLFVQLCPAPSSSLVMRRTSLISGWNEEMLIADDWCLVLDMVLHRAARAAFTLVPHWTKCVQQDNVYDGRAQLEVIERLGFHDEVLLAERFGPQLQVDEKAYMRRRLATHHFHYAYHKWKASSRRRVVARALLAAFSLSPLHIGRYALQAVFQLVKSRTRRALAWWAR